MNCFIDSASWSGGRSSAVWLTVAVLLSGCAMTDFSWSDQTAGHPESMPKTVNTTVAGTAHEAQPGETEKHLPAVDLSRFYGELQDKNINHYVRGMMHDLVNNLHYVNDKTPIGVTSFIFLDGAYDKSGLLGNQIAESFVHEVHQFGIPVIDFKTTDYIRVTEAGDFIFSRDFLDLKEVQPIKYVLAGTLTKHRGGYLVNARIIGLLSKAVVASAQGFIPGTVADALLPSGQHNAVSLLQG